MLQVMLMLIESLERFTKGIQKITRQILELKKQSIEKVINYMSNRKATIILLKVGFIKNYIVIKNDLFSKTASPQKKENIS